MTRVQERMETDDERTWRRLLQELRGATEECPELRELWELRLELARYMADSGEIAIARNRLGLENGIDESYILERVSRGAFNPSSPIAKRWALVAGTSEFSSREITFANPLRFASEDLSRMHSLFDTTLGFDEVRSLTGPAFTLDGFNAEIARLREEVAEDDLLVIYLLSHGVSSASDPNAVSFILTYDSDNTDIRSRYLTAIGAGALVREIYSEIRAQRIVLILDTCYSGNAIAGQRAAGLPAPHLLEWFAGDSGRAVIAAAGEHQRSYELTDVEQHGAFVYCFDRFASDSLDAPLGELFASVSRCVTDTVRERLNSTQVPALFASDAARQLVIGSGR